MLRQGGNVRDTNSLDILADSRVRHILSSSPLFPHLSSCFVPLLLSSIHNSHTHYHLHHSLLPSLCCFNPFISLPHLQCWLELSSTSSNRHWITINPASLNLPIVIVLRKEKDGREEIKRRRRNEEEWYILHNTFMHYLLCVAIIRMWQSGEQKKRGWWEE